LRESHRLGELARVSKFMSFGRRTFGAELAFAPNERIAKIITLFPHYEI
jgi:hypothetical protein